MTNDLLFSITLLRTEVIKQEQHLDVFCTRAKRGECRDIIIDLQKSIKILELSGQ